jgi:hypothetical protein
MRHIVEMVENKKERFGYRKKGEVKSLDSLSHFLKHLLQGIDR